MATLKIHTHETSTTRYGSDGAKTVTVHSYVVAVHGGMNRMGFTDQAFIGKQIQPYDLPAALELAEIVAGDAEIFERLAGITRDYWAQPAIRSTPTADELAWLAAAERRGDDLGRWMAEAAAESESDAS